MNNHSNETLHYDFIETDLGLVIIAANDEGLCYVSFQNGPKLIAPPEGWVQSPKKLTEVTRQMKEYFSGERQQFDLPLAPSGTEFQQKVWKVLTEIPYGQTITYGELAKRIKQPQASRAVGNANGRNPIVIIQPCHRVVAANGKLGGFSSGLHRKEYLLGLERRVSRLF